MKLYIVLMLRKWEKGIALVNQAGTEVDVGVDKSISSIGFLEVFDNIEQLKKEYPTADLLVMEETKKVEAEK